MRRWIHLTLAGLLCSIWIAGCDESTPSIITDVEARVSEHIQTVITVRWNTTEESIGYVEYGPSEEFGYTTPVESSADTEHEVMLLGMTPDTEVFYRVVIWNDADVAGEAGETASIHTGYLPANLPSLNLTPEDSTANDQYIIVPFMGVNTGVIIISPAGEIVWAWVDDRPFEYFRAYLSRDGKAILYNAASVSGDEAAKDSEIVRVSLDGSDVSSITVPNLAHDFVEMADGTIGAITITYRDFEGSPLRGNAIVEIDPDTGDQTEVWDVWDCFDPAVHIHDTMEGQQGWTFCNALDYYPKEDVYYIGSLEFSSIIKVDRQTKECPVVIGGVGSNMSFVPGTGYPFMGQHQFDVRGNAIVVFDNSGHPSSNSRVVEYSVDTESMEYAQTWQHVGDVSTFVLGDVTRLTQDNTFVTWSSSGRLSFVDEDSDDLWQINTAMGFAFGFHSLHTSLYGTNDS